MNHKLIKITLRELAMKSEKYKAENSDEIVWLRLNRLKSNMLCEKLIKSKLEKEPNSLITDEIIKAKAIGLSSAIESAIGYWQSQSSSLNSRILSRYYFMLQMTIAEQVSSINNTDGLKEIQKHTESGHGLGTIAGPDNDFPDSYFVFALNGGHFFSYAKLIGIDVKSITLDKRPHKFSDVTEVGKLVSLTDLFRRIPELNKVIEEYVGKPPLALHVGYSQTHNLHEMKAARNRMIGTENLTLEEPGKIEEKTTYVSIYPDSNSLTPEYLTGLSLPFSDFTNYEDPHSKHTYIIAKLLHPSDLHWHQHLNTYGSSYATNSHVVPLWTKQYDSIVTNFSLLYALSIIVRYQPDLWYRINSGDINHMGSLIEYYISVMDHVLPLQMLERITGIKISINNPGSFFGEI